MRVERLIVGWFTAAAGIWRRGDDLDRQVRFPVPAYLVETGDERILVDAGVHPDAVTDPARRYGRPDALGPVKAELERSIAEQLDLATITRVVLTHLHYDHAGGLALLPPSVPVVVQRAEWEAAHDEAAIAKNFYLPPTTPGWPTRRRLWTATTTCSATARCSSSRRPATHPATNR